MIKHYFLSSRRRNAATITGALPSATSLSHAGQASYLLRSCIKIKPIAAIALLAVVMVTGSCKKKPSPTRPIDRITGVYEGADSFSYTSYSGRGGRNIGVERDTQWSRITVVTDTVARLTDTSFRISFPGSVYGISDQINFDGSYHYNLKGNEGPPTYRNITFYPEQDSIVIEQQDVNLFSLHQNPIGGWEGRVEYYYHQFRGKKR